MEDLTHKIRKKKERSKILHPHYLR